LIVVVAGRVSTFPDVGGDVEDPDCGDPADDDVAVLPDCDDGLLLVVELWAAAIVAVDSVTASTIATRFPIRTRLREWCY
jgi:hypothetical protein